MNLIVLHAKFSDMENIATSLEFLKNKQRQFVLSLMDSIFEEIYRQIERNDFKEAQRRVAVMRFLGEAYNNKLIYTETVIDILYRLINYDIELRQTDAYLE